MVMLQAFRQFCRAISVGPRDHQALALLRVVVGLGFLWMGQYQLNHPEFTPLWKAQWQAWADHHPWPLYGQWMRGSLLPHFALLLRVGVDLQMLVGGSFLLGLGISLSSWLALLWGFNLWLATLPLTSHQGDFGLWLFSSLLLLLVLSLRWAGAGRYYGLAGLLAQAWRQTHGNQAAPRNPNGGSGRGASLKSKEVRRSGTRVKKSGPGRGSLRPSRLGGAGLEKGAAEADPKVRPFTRPQGGPQKTTSAKIRKLEKAVQREAEKRQQPPVPPPPESLAGSEKKPQPLTPKQTAPVVDSGEAEALKVVKIFDHRTPDDDD